MNKKALIIASFAKSLCLFRLDLIKTLLAKGYEVVACAPLDEEIGDVRKCLNALNVRFVPIKLNNTGLNIFFDFSSLTYIYKVIKQENPRLLLSYTIKPVIYGSLVAKLAKITNIYSIITGLGYVFTSQTLKTKILRFIVEKIYKIALVFNKKVFFSKCR